MQNYKVLQLSRTWRSPATKALISKKWWMIWLNNMNNLKPTLNCFMPWIGPLQELGIKKAQLPLHRKRMAFCSSDSSLMRSYFKFNTSLIFRMGIIMTRLALIFIPLHWIAILHPPLHRNTLIRTHLSSGFRLLNRDLIQENFACSCRDHTQLTNIIIFLKLIWARHWIVISNRNNGIKVSLCQLIFQSVLNQNMDLKKNLIAQNSQHIALI